MTAQSSTWRPGRRLWFVLAAVLVNGALAAWFLLPFAQTSPPVPEQPPPDEEPILFKNRLQVKLTKETVEQSIEQLPDFDDTVPTMACLGNMAINGMPHTYAYAILYYPNLNRVRKILEEGRDNRERVTPILKEKLTHAMDDYKQIMKEFWKRLNSGPIVSSSCDEFEKRRIYTASSVYLLCQLGDYDALPLMEKLFIAQGDIPKLFTKGEMPFDVNADLNAIVNRLFLFYIMHHLVRNYPRDKLTPQALKRLDEYLEASKAIPTYKEVSIPSWRATFDPWDYRLTILHKDLGMDKQPHLRVYEFPTTIPYLEDMEGTPRPQVLAWFAKMKRFIEEVYPADAKPAPKPKGTSS